MVVVVLLLVIVVVVVSSKMGEQTNVIVFNQFVPRKNPVLHRHLFM